MTAETKPARRRMSPLARREAIDGYIGILPWLIGFLAFTLLPLCAAVGLSFCYWDILTPIRWAGVENYLNILRDPLVKNALWNTFRYTVVVVPATTALGLAIAMMLNQRTKGILFFRIVYYLPSVLPGVAVAMLWMWMFNPDFGVINTMLSYIGIQGPAWLNDKTWAMWAIVIRACWGVGGGMILFLAALQGVPVSYYEAATIDGANAWHRFRHIVIPMIKPNLVFVLIMSTISAFMLFTPVDVLTMGRGTPGTSTMVLMLHIKIQGIQLGETGYTSAVSILLLTIILTISLVQWFLSRENKREGRRA